MVIINLWKRWKFAGTLSPRFSELPDLQGLILGQTRASGDIGALKNLTELKVLNLVETEVSGNILALENLTKLKWLYLSYTKVSGNLSALENLRELSKLDLEYTEVIGDMSSLRSTSLENRFNIEGTEITCDEAALRAVLRSLGLQAEQLTDLMHFKGVERMLSCRNMKGFLICFLHMIWWIKLDHAWPE